VLERAPGGPPPADTMFERALEVWDRTVGPDAPHRGAILLFLVLLIVWGSYRASLRPLSRYLGSRAQKPENVTNFLLIYRYVWLGVTVVFALVGASGRLESLGLSAAFVGMVLGWSLQQPVTGVAAWLMILLKRPFRLGDRVIISGVIGDVVDINLTHVVLNQVGGTVSGEEKSGRGVLIPNATLFGQVIYNYALEGATILDEVAVRVTYDSDHALAEALCLEAVREVTADIVATTRQEPYARCELFDSGVLFRLRYRTRPDERQRISSDISRRILAAFCARPDRVRFAYPHSEVRYRTAPEGGGPPWGG
jgi:small-conductance mechanosensitive channel